MKPDQFWAHVQKGEGCWLWTGTKDDRGYGRIKMMLDGVRVQLAHRAAFILVRGHHPVDLHHTCQNESCVNPDHLDPIGRAANSRIQRWPERCPQGHEFDSSYVNRKGYRVRECSTCVKERRRRYSARPEVKARRAEWARRKYAQRAHAA